MLYKQGRTRETCWRQLLSFLEKREKEKGREAKVRMVLSRQKHDTNILADKAQGGFVYELKRINRVR